jgi:hypothetical protein
MEKANCVILSLKEVWKMYFKNNNQSNSDTNEIINNEEFLDIIHDVETININDGTDLLNTELTEEERDRILDITLSKIKDEKNKDNGTIINKTRKSGKKRWALIAALAAVFVLATTAIAAEVFNWDHRIANYLGINNNNSSNLAESGMILDVSSEQNGVIIKAVQTLGDANNMYILLDLTTPEGTKINPGSRFDMIYLKVDGSTGLGYSCDFLPDESENDNKATLLLSMNANNNINDKTISLIFKDLGHYVSQSDQVITDFKGTWKLEWKLNYKDISLKYPVNKKLTVNKETVNVNSVEISPIAITVKISGDYIKKYDSAPPEPRTGDLIQIKAINFKDGTVLSQENASEWGTSIDGDKYVIYMQMKKLIDQKQIESILINDTLVPLK